MSGAVQVLEDFVETAEELPDDLCSLLQRLSTLNTQIEECRTSIYRKQCYLLRPSELPSPPIPSSSIDIEVTSSSATPNAPTLTTTPAPSTTSPPPPQALPSNSAGNASSPQKQQQLSLPGTIQFNPPAASIQVLNPSSSLMRKLEKERARLQDLLGERISLQQELLSIVERLQRKFEEDLLRHGGGYGVEHSHHKHHLHSSSSRHTQHHHQGSQRHGDSAGDTDVLVEAFLTLPGEERAPAEAVIADRLLHYPIMHSANANSNNLFAFDFENSADDDQLFDDVRYRSSPPPPQQPAGERVFCVCQRVAFGQMIACVEATCPVEWYHLDCVNQVLQQSQSQQSDSSLSRSTSPVRISRGSAGAGMLLGWKCPHCRSKQ